MKTLALLVSLILAGTAGANAICTVNRTMPIAIPGRFSEMWSLHAAGYKDQATRLAACVANKGDRVMELNSDWGTVRTIRILEGRWVGCVGEIKVDHLDY